MILRQSQIRRPQGRAVWIAAGIAALLFAIAVILPIVLGGKFESGTNDQVPLPTKRARLPQSELVEPIIYEADVMPIAADTAVTLNADRPVDLPEVSPATAFAPRWAGAEDPYRMAAIKCLAQAIYYEAASEPLEGKRAVAQVIINRVRSPAFPNSVCSVVYQGSRLRTGCQFTFTCDGSLARVPSRSGYAQAERIAREALSGTVAKSVGYATHYHANYVVPYWASSLDKAATIGAHIFYIMRGSIGRARSFAVRYNPLGETIPSSAMTLELDPNILAEPEPAVELTDIVPPAVLPHEDRSAGRLIVAPPEAVAGGKIAPGLRADERRGDLLRGPGGRLIIDEKKAAPSSPAQTTPTAPE